MSENKAAFSQFERSPVNYYLLRLQDFLDRISIKKPSLSSGIVLSEDFLQDSSVPEEAKERYRQSLDYLKEGKETEERLKAATWQEKGFSLRQAVEKTTGPVIEVAGPTDEGFHLIKKGELKGLEKPVFISNIEKGCPVWEGEDIKYYGQVDFQADARYLPFANNTIGTVFLSCLPIDLRKEAIKEISRVVEAGGIFVFQGAVGTDIKQVEETGLDLKKYRRYFNGPEKSWTFDCIFQKRSVDNPLKEKVVKN